MDYTYTAECDHGETTITMYNCKKVPPEFYETPCPFGGGELIRARRQDTTAESWQKTAGAILSKDPEVIQKRLEELNPLD